MADTPNKIQWHPAFYAAAELELHENIEQLELKTEYNLSKEPIRIDLLVINGDAKNAKIRNEIGHIMRKYNVIEYKSPEDNLTIDDFYKTIGYACLFKGYGKIVNQIPTDELTVSIFRESYPRKMFLTIRREGHRIEEKYPGIYYVHDLPFPVQIVVIKQLRSGEHKSLKVLSANVKKEDVKEFLKETEELCSLRQKQNIDAVLQASVRANYDLYEEIRRETTMCEALRELMKDEIEKDVNAAKEIAIKEGKELGIAQGREEGREEGRAEGRAEGRVEGRAEGEANLIRIMYKNGVPAEQIASSTGKKTEEVKAILAE